MLVAGNWKMFKGPRETVEFLDSFEPPAGVDVVVCPPFVSLAAAVGRGIPVYAQNVHWAPEGAFTGEVSAAMLREVGVEGAIVGHSERRQYFGETDEIVALKAKIALKHNMIPIVCVGEGLEVRQAGNHLDHCTAQVEGSLAGLTDAEVGQVVIAYEPVWAIGTGETATAQDAQEVCAGIRDQLEKSYGAEIADGVRILYGGSVKPNNVAALMQEADVDGALVGGASLSVEDFAAISRYYDLPVL